MGTVVMLVDVVGGAGADLDVLEDRVIEEDLGFGFVFLPSVARSVLQRSKRKSIFSPIARHFRWLTIPFSGLRPSPLRAA